MAARRYDFVAIGGGNAGLTAAGGRKVALVDRGPVGGLCSLAGCDPKQTLAGELIPVFALAIRFGIGLEDLRRTVHGYRAFGSSPPYPLG